MNPAARFAPRRLAVSALAALCTLAAVQPVLAQWKWRDKAGQIHVSDLPPPAGVADESILQRPTTARGAPPAGAPGSSTPASAPASAAAIPPAATAPASNPANRLEAEVEARRRKAEQEEKAKQKAIEDKNAEARAENCVRAKRHLATLESGQRMARINDKGEREIIDDRLRAEEMQAARSVVSSDCK